MQKTNYLLFSFYGFLNVILCQKVNTKFYNMFIKLHKRTTQASISLRGFLKSAGITVFFRHFSIFRTYKQPRHLNDKVNK